LRRGRLFDTTDSWRYTPLALHSLPGYIYYLAEEEHKVISEFKAFINKGNVLDLAVALILAVAFGLIVSSFVADILMPIIGGILGGASFGDLSFRLGDATIRYGNFLNTIINFLIVAFAMFLIVRAYNRMQKPASDPTVKECRFCLSIIPAGASRCPNCTSAQDVA
jgi:large conductance mechanosensitive channel